MDNSYEQWEKSRCKGMMRSYLRGKRTSLNMITAFLNPPNEAPLSHETVENLLQQVLLEMPHPIPERLLILKEALRVQYHQP